MLAATDHCLLKYLMYVNNNSYLVLCASRIGIEGIDTGWHLPDQARSTTDSFVPVNPNGI